MMQETIEELKLSEEEKKDEMIQQQVINYIIPS